MIRWQLFPKSLEPTSTVLSVVAAFEGASTLIDSSVHQHSSNDVLAHVHGGLTAAGFLVETGKTKAQKISVPVLFGRNGKPDKTFDADAFNKQEAFVLEVEAGRGVVNNQFLKDLFQACMMQGVDYLGVAVRNKYDRSDDFEYVCRFFDTLYASDRLALPLRGLLVIGY